MREVLTKSMARNIFFGGSLFFIFIFAALFVHSHLYILNVSTDHAGPTASQLASICGKRTAASIAIPFWAKVLISRLSLATS